ncbi:hypothetical protein F2Q68_00021718 [Brassica cretica]|uniref:Uncharacterized protein n=1 Tax=Brassica cretica TaxID=69181 RepID=A0A8S9FSM3_BRACR|nr:hypothetical protein F2Q68_00021718 [Brassica cretica]
MSDRPAINEHVSKARTHPSTGTKEKNGEAPPTGKRTTKNHQNGLNKGLNREIYMADLRIDENINRLQSILQLRLSCMTSLKIKISMKMQKPKTIGKENHRSFRSRDSETEKNRAVDQTEPGKTRTLAGDSYA